MTGIIDDLGRALIGRWRAKGYAERDFASIVATTLEEFGLDEQVEGVLEHVFVHSEGLLLDDHIDAEIACVFAAAQFSIYVHPWVNGLVPMHHHAWTGAYQLLRGSSVEARYSFREERRLTAGFSLGELQCEGIDDLSAGDIRLVEPGPKNIHALSYNDLAGLTISVRSRRVFGEKSVNYWRPGVAIELGIPNYMKARNRCLRYLSNTDRPELMKRLRVWISQGDLRTVFFGLEATHGLSTPISAADWGELIDIGKAAHGSIFERIALAARDTKRSYYHRSLMMRIGANDYDLRKFLSSLFVSADREVCFARLGAAYGLPDRMEECREWCRRILALDSGDGMEAGLLAVLDNLLLTGSIEETISNMASRYEVDEETMSLVRQVCEHFRSHPALGILVRG